MRLRISWAKAQASGALSMSCKSRLRNRYDRFCQRRI
jgi:hypothetical protein